MPAKQQTHAKRARELAVRERRELKRAKKAERAAGKEPGVDGITPGAEGQEEPVAAEWIQ